MNEIITLIMKPIATSCNLRCSYCYHRASREKKLNRMSIGILRRLIQGCSTLPQGKIRFIWHGGEPLSAGIDFYKQVFKLQKHFLKDKKVINTMQTNATLITEGWRDFFKENFPHGVGISLDGPEYIHDLYRRYSSDKGTFNKVLDGINLLKQAGIKIGILAVVTKQSVKYPKEIFAFLLSLGLQLSGLQFNPCVEYGKDGRVTDYSLSPEEYSRFMIEIFDLWMKTGNPRIKIKSLYNMLEWFIMGRQPSLCMYKRDCSNYICVGPDGSVYHCGRFFQNSEFKIGDLRSESLTRIVNSKNRIRISNLISSIKKECVSCRWLNFCNGGEPCHRYNAGGSLSSPYYFCEATKQTLEYIEKAVSGSGLILKPSNNEVKEWSLN